MARTKIVHYIEYKDKGADLKIPLKLATETSSGGRAPSFSYLIHLDDPVHVRLEGKDPEVLTKQLFELLNAHFEISWKPFLYVRVYTGEPNENYCGSESDGRELKLSVNHLLVGAKPDGTVVHDFYHGISQVYTGGSHRPRYNNYSKGLPETTRMKNKWRGSGDDGQECVAMIEDTPENRAALKAIQKAMKELATKLSDLLAPDAIQATLINMPAVLNIGMSKS